MHKCGNQLEFVQANVSDIKYDNGKWHITGENNNNIATADCAVVTNGSLAGQFSVLEWLPVEAVRGQLTIVEQTNTSRRIKLK